MRLASCHESGNCLCPGSAGVRARDSSLHVLQRGRGREASDLQDFLFVQGLPLQQSLGQRLELLAVLREQTAGLLVALIDDARYLFVYGSGGLLTIGSFSAVTARSTKVGVFAGRELDSSQLLAHPPPRDHRTSEVGGLLYVALGTRGPCAVDDLLRAAPSQSAYDPG